MAAIGQKEFKFNVKQVLATLKKNAEVHKQEYNELVVKNTNHIRFELENLLEQMRANPSKIPNFDKFNEAVRAQPTDHSDDYQKIIRMLEITTQDECSFTVDEFDCYMNDNWHWKHELYLNKTLYGMV